MSGGPIQLERVGDIFVLTMRNGENRFNTTSVAAIHTALDEVEASADSVAVVVTGEGKYFSNGLDLEWLMGVGFESEAGGDFFKGLYRLFLRTLVAPYATVAAVNGHTFAAGAMWMTAFDYRVMRIDRGYFCLPEVDLGLPFTDEMNAVLTTRLPRLTAHEAMATGRRYAAEEALEVGLVDRAVGAGEVQPCAVEWAAGMASKAGPTMGTIKRRLHSVAVEVLESGLAT